MPKLSPRQEADAASREPGYWPNYREPSKLARSIERPLADPNWQGGVLGAYAQTKFLALRKEAPDAHR